MLDKITEVIKDAIFEQAEQLPASDASRSGAIQSNIACLLKARGLIVRMYADRQNEARPGEGEGRLTIDIRRPGSIYDDPENYRNVAPVPVKTD